ncbi:MAG: transcription-repair coupling factor [Bacteroidales bacterium]|nr:transcription-repair coupling factor [Bacteroidales bacterium]
MNGIGFTSPLLPTIKENFSALGACGRIGLSGLAGASYPLLVKALLASPLSSHQIFVFPEREEALYFYHDLEKLFDDIDKPLSEKSVHYFPCSYRRIHKIDETDNANIKFRSEIINKFITQSGNYIIVTYPEAIAEKLVSRKYLQTNSHKLRCGEALSIDALLDFLYKFNYTQVDFVCEPGEFAWRGGIFDIFSYSEEYPYRLELDGDDISSIRFFDPSTQLSIKEVDTLQIIPKVSSTEIVEQRISFFDFIGDNATVWLKNIPQIKNELETNYKKIVKEYEETADNATIKQFTPEQLFIDGSQFLKSIINYKTVEINSQTFENYALTLDLGITPQNSFSKNTDMLFDEWIDNYEKGYKTVFLCENEHQIERMNRILTDNLSKFNWQNQTNYTLEQLYEPSTFVLYEGFRDEAGKLCVYTDHQIFEKYYRFDVRSKYKKSEAFTLKEIYDLQPGDYVVHVDHGIGIYSGLQKMDINGKEQEVIKLTYKDGDLLYISIHSLHKISKYVGKDGTPPTLHRLGSGTWDKVKERTKRRVKELAVDLIKLYAKRKTQKGFAFSEDNYLQTELEASFMFEDTPDQLKTTNEVKADMESEHPMDRLICGDVGFGKTEVAIRAAFKAVCDSKQVAVLVPTTVLALQHFTTFNERLHNMPCKVDYINRFKSTKQIKESLKRLEEGQTDIVIGTHRILSKDVKFKDLGLLIIDEEQKFGVGAKEKLRELKTNVDTLTMSATPIPRTLQFSLMGARDISVIATPPPNRYPIQTEIHVFNEELIRDAVSYELSRGGQVFIVHNKIQNIKDIADMVKRLVPDARVAVGHGQMDGEVLEKTMLDFIDGGYDVLVSTTIVESGLDITNANTIIINDAQNYALNMLHQLRGRVGRNNRKAFCYLLIRSFEELNDQARKRLKAIEDYSEIGSGLQIAMRDLDIRGAGDILGAEQSGFIHEIGFETYQKILTEAITELQETVDFQDIKIADNSALLQRECILETDIGAMFPTEYISSVSERMSLYKELDNIKTDEQLEKFRQKVVDMFGPLPREAEELIQLVPLRRKAASYYFDKISIKRNTFTGYFIANSDSHFYQSDLFSKILLFMQKNHPQVQIKEKDKKLLLIIKNIPTIKAAMHWLEKLDNFKVQ